MADKGAWGKTTKFFREVKAELKKVNWPNRKELVSYTMVVIVTVLLVALFIGGVDFVFANIIRPIILD
ncbi:preprotein translocase subunit SecE [Orenia metallireducens]|jgi:preprotein translocase subunit SecE|uniref:Protein translocase subunit SecE n=1 Tax=Orenia metallireducens TaxID=1413210 RepID=A0A1C0ABW0_9FIRM|nr:preprotein translocase subunit SecE [Orenia metallireducens]OCL27851.1 preprotein translocase subunit SecE [Orenia metallireducens]